MPSAAGYLRRYKRDLLRSRACQSKLWPAGTLCVTIAANIAKTAILTFDACFPDSVVGFTASRPSVVEYVRVFLSFLQRQLEDKAPESAQKNINLKTLRSIPMPVPPDVMIEEFSERLAAIQKVETELIQSKQHCDELFLGIQQRAFRGDL